MLELSFGDYLTGHSFLPLETVGWKTGYIHHNFSIYQCIETKVGALINPSSVVGTPKT